MSKTVDYTEEVCNDRYVQSCAEKWEVINGAKVWVPDTTRCQNLVSLHVQSNDWKFDTNYHCLLFQKQTECHEEKRQRYEPEEKCDYVPYQDCEQIHGQRPQQVVCAEVSLVNR